MNRNRESYPGTLSVLGFAVGCALAGFMLRLLLVPAGLVGRTANLMMFEGDFWWYIVRAFLFALFAGIAGAIIAAVHNEFLKRS
jgi:hypothetical protein